MRRQKLIQHLRAHGCVVVREGAKHTWVSNPAKRLRSLVPRHREINTHTAAGICKDLGIPPPREG